MQIDVNKLRTISYYILSNTEWIVNDNIRMYKKWKIKMYKNEYFYIP